MKNIPLTPFIMNLPKQPIKVDGVPTGFAFELRVRVLSSHQENGATVVDDCEVLDIGIVPAAPHAR